MGKLWVRVALLSTFSVVLTLVLLMLIQDVYEARAARDLNPSLRAAAEAIQTQPGLTGEQQLELFRDALRRTAANDAEVRQLAQLLGESRATRQRVPRLAALISLPIAVLLSTVLAWFIARPVRNVTRAAARVTEGDLSARAPQFNGSRAGDELTELTGNFNLMAENLERLENERKEMIADVAHELRTPLTILQGQIDALREGVRPVDDAALAKLEHQTQHLTRLVEDLRVLSAADAGRLPLELQTVDLARLAQRVTAGFEVKAAAKGMVLSFTCDLRQNALVQADPHRLEQVLGNLLENAVRYTPEAGTVAVCVAKQQDAAVLEVKDSGPGLSEDAIQHVFDRFYRVDSSRGRALGGSGLGLAISKALVTLHGGRLEAANRAAGGAVFRVILPAVFGKRV